MSEIMAMQRTELSQQATVAQGPQQYLTFKLQGELFGLNIQPIKEITEYGKITPVPMVPDSVRGVINLRGNVVPVIDLPVHFGWKASPLTKRTCIVIVELDGSSGPKEIGIVIDSVCEVLDIADENICAAPSFGAKVRTDFISGMGKVNDDFIVLLNTDKVLSIDELSQLKQLPMAH
ncbi:MAG: chemotaxis protein CheW [Motiliproteus sp.]